MLPMDVSSHHKNREEVCMLLFADKDGFDEDFYKGVCKYAVWWADKNQYTGFIYVGF